MERGQNAGLNMNLTGRVSWWDFALRKWEERPLTGHGAHAGGRFASLAAMGQSSSHLHSTYMEALVGTGLIGLGLVALVVAATWKSLALGLRRAAIGSSDRHLTTEVAAVLGLLTFRSFFATHLVWHPSLVFLVAIAYAEYLRRRPAAEAGR